MVGTNNSDLALVAEAIQQWRQQKRSRGEPMPEELRGRILALEAEYTRSELMECLNLSGHFFPLKKPKASKPRVAFTKVNPVPEIQKKSSARVCELEFPSGLILRVPV